MESAIKLPRATPEAQGVSSAAILAYIEDAEAQGLELHGLMLLRRGNVLAEGWWNPYRPDLPHMLYSLSKSFTSTAAGLAIAEGHFSLDDPVISFFPDELPESIAPNLKAMRVRDLLSMATGHEKEPFLWQAPDGSWVRQFLAAPVPHQPGTHFLYNTPATYMVSAIIQKKTGKHLLDYLTPRLLEPLGISGATWENCPRGIATGGWGLNIRTEDIARFGLLYQQNGMWNGMQVVPADWVAQATAKQISNGNDPKNDWNQGYGFQFWRCRHGAYRGDGAFGQFCIVMPEQEAVLAINSGVGNMGEVMNLAWKHLLPAMSKDTRPENPSAHQRLTEKLARLRVPAPPGETASPVVAQVSGKNYRFHENDAGIQSATFDFAENSVTLTVTDARGTHRLESGIGDWETGETAFLQTNIWRANPSGRKTRYAANAAWKDDRTLVVKLSFIETPFGPTLAFRFDRDRITLDIQGSIGFGPTERPLLEGEAVA